MICPKCKTEIPTNSKKCPNPDCDYELVHSQQAANSGCAIIFIIIVMILVAWFTSCSKKDAEEYSQSETTKFEGQFKQDPSTWNKEQRDRYNNFMDWESKQQANK